MNLRLVAFAVLALCLSVDAEDSASISIPGLIEPETRVRVSGVKVSIPELLVPETRLRAYQEFCLRSMPGEAKQFNWTELQSFADWHGDLTVSELRGGKDAPRYLLTWHSGLASGDWSKVDSLSPPSAPAANVLVPVSGLRYQIFSADGSPLLAEEGYVSDGQIADLNGDGEPEEIERESSRSSIPGVEPTASGKLVEMEYEFLQVRPPDYPAPVSFAVLYNMHPKERAVGNTWGFQLRDTDHDGFYEIELGPVLAPKGVEPKVTFRWDKAKQTWTGPEPRKGDHFLVLQGKEPVEEVSRIAKAGGLGYPLAPAPESKTSPGEHSDRGFDSEDLPPERLSKAYRYRSLASLSDEEILAYMGQGRRAWDYINDRMREVTSVPDFWTLSPERAALAYVQANRPSDIHPYYLLSFYNPGNEVAPAEGDLTLSDGPSGCFSPGGAYVHHIHCAPEGSYLACAETTHYWFQVLPTENRTRFDFRKLDLPYEDARHILQSVWWMSRIRSRHLISGSSMDHMSGGSTSDGFASVQIVSGERNVLISDSRSAGHAGTFLGVGTGGEDYDPSAFINLVVQLFRREIPDRLGKAWTSQRIPVRWKENAYSPEPHTAEELVQVKNMSAELLRRFCERKLAAGAVVQVVGAVGEMGWSDLRPMVEQIATMLPPLMEHEKRIAKINEEIKPWEEKLGAEASERAYRLREQRRFASKYPVRVLPEPGTFEEPKAEPEDGKFTQVDALYEARNSVMAPQPEQDIAQLRKAVPTALRQLDCYNDPDALFAWAMEDELATGFVLSRLARLDSQRAIKLLRHLEADAEDEESKRMYVAACKALEAGGAAALPNEGTSVLTDEERAAELATLRNADAHYDDRRFAFASLIPLNDPKRYPDPAIDAALRELLTRELKEREIVPEGTPFAAAQRLGGKAWDAIVAYAEAKRFIGIPQLREALPALTLIAQREPDPYKSKLRELLVPELRATYGYLNGTLWSIWQLDLRELSQELERIATNGPEDYESSRGDGGSNHKQPVKHRFHLARQIVALWKEEDALTRARLLVAFATAHAQQFSHKTNGAIEHLRSELATLRANLAPAQQSKLAEFIGWCEANAAAKLGERSDSSSIAAVLASIR